MWFPLPDPASQARSGPSPPRVAAAPGRRRRPPRGATTARSSVARRASSGAPQGHRRLGHQRGRPPVHVPAVVGRSHGVALVQLEACAVMGRLRLLRQAKKPKRARARRPRHLYRPSNGHTKTSSASATSQGIADAAGKEKHQRPSAGKEQHW